MKNEIPDGWIEKYVEGSLEGNELLSFEKRMSEDSALRQNIELLKDVKEKLGDHTFKKLENITSKVGKDYFKIDQKNDSKPERQLFFLSKKIKVIAAILVGLIIGTWYFLSTSTEPNEQLYAQFAQHDFSLTQLNNPTALNKIENLLSDNQYELALTEIESYLNQFPNDPDLLMAKGICFLEIGNDYDSALAIFTTIHDINPIYANEGLWYSALTYLRKNEREKCISILNKIPSSSQKFRLKNELLEKIK